MSIQPKQVEIDPTNPPHWEWYETKFGHACKTCTDFLRETTGNQEMFVMRPCGQLEIKLPTSPCADGDFCFRSPTGQIIHDQFCNVINHGDE